MLKPAEIKKKMSSRTLCLVLASKPSKKFIECRTHAHSMRDLERGKSDVVYSFFYIFGIINIISSFPIRPLYPKYG